MWKSNHFIPMAIVGTAVFVSCLAPAIALEPQEIRARAAKFVVRIDGAGGGTGFIVRKSGNRYTVLTNEHVIKSVANYTILTVDNLRYTVDSSKIKKLPGVDLAEIEFTSTNNYSIAELNNNPKNLSGGEKIFAYGWNSVSEALIDRADQILTGTIAGILFRSVDGYNLTLNLPTVPGLSGSPLMDKDGKVIGIYGFADRQGGGFTLTLGIPISTYQNYLYSNKAALINTKRERIDWLVEKTKNQVLIGDSPNMGATNQQIVLVAFSDFQCLSCVVANKSIKQFMIKHKDKVTLVYKYFPLTQIHPEALPAARAAWAANKQGKFWEYHDALYANQAKLGENFYVGTATSLKLNLNKFNADRKLADNSISEDFKLGLKLRVEGTPTFFINEKMLTGSISLADLEEALLQTTKK
jgi:protein-disulfide isomerase